MCVDKVVERPEDPFPRVCESVTYGKSRNIVNEKTPIDFGVKRSMAKVRGQDCLQCSYIIRK